MAFTALPLTINAKSDILTAEAERLFSDLALSRSPTLNPPTILVGSGVSLWQPAGLPSGQDFTQAMYSVLFENQLDLSSREKRLLQKIFGKEWSREFSGMPFEHLMENCPSEEKANALINRFYTSRRPNPVHQALAGGLKTGKIHSIITTNYDCCIDEALELEKFSYIKAVTADQAAVALEQKDLPCYFKIHGSTEPGMEHTPMFTLRHEGLLNPDKRRLLARLLENRPLVLIGYSGLDFELCPEIERIGLDEIIWNDLYPEPPSVSAGRLLDKKNGRLIYGDMRIFARNWLGMDHKPEKTEDKSSVVADATRDIFTDEEISRWRIAVLNSLGLPALVFKAFDRAALSSANSYFASTQRGRAHFHAGKYKTARRYFRAAAIYALRRRQLAEAADAALETSDAYRSYGAPVRAYICTWSVTWLRADRLKAKKLVKQSLVIKDFIEVAKAAERILGGRLKIAFVKSLIEKLFGLAQQTLRNALQKKLISCARESLREGNWIDFQQTALIAEGLGIDVPAVSEENYYLPPKAAEGYRHLAYYIPQTMVFYDRCLREQKHPAASEETRREWKRHVRICRMMKVNSSLWKILALSSSDKIKGAARQIFEQCEYGYFKRKVDWRKFAK